MINIIICGAPGCGKGTQSDLIVKKYNLTHISTGDLLRKEISDKTELGTVAHQYISQGQLVPDEMIIEMLARKIALNCVRNISGWARQKRMARHPMKGLDSSQASPRLGSSLSPPRSRVRMIMGAGAMRWATPR